jgi:hypothetical protein
VTDPLAHDVPAALAPLAYAEQRRVLRAALDRFNIARLEL